jgi:carbamoyl-phosphate synthase large subunit
LDLAEDRGRFSELLTELKISFHNLELQKRLMKLLLLMILDFPLLIRPSYVLGQGMKIVINKQELEEHVVNLLKTIPGNKLLLDHYLDGAIEEADAICDGENVYIMELWISNLECTLEIVMRHYRLI